MLPQVAVAGPVTATTQAAEDGAGQQRRRGSASPVLGPFGPNLGRAGPGPLASAPGCAREFASARDGLGAGRRRRAARVEARVSWKAGFKLALLGAGGGRGCGAGGCCSDGCGEPARVRMAATTLVTATALGWRGDGGRSSRLLPSSYALPLAFLDHRRGGRWRPWRRGHGEAHFAPLAAADGTLPAVGGAEAQVALLLARLRGQRRLLRRWSWGTGGWPREAVT